MVARDVTDATSADPLTIGRRLRHRRREAGRTLEDLAREIGLSSSALSLIENGRREARLSTLSALAAALDTTLGALLDTAAPTRRAALEIELERAQRADGFEALGLPQVRIGPRLPTEVLEQLVGLHRALDEVRAERSATPEEARRANAALRVQMREQGNYFPDIEDAAIDLMRAADLGDGPDGPDGPVTRSAVERMAAHLGFRLRTSSDLPESTRSITDLAERIIYLPQQAAAEGDPRTLALQALGHVVLGHAVPTDYASFLRQRVEVNYFGAALLMPERGLLTKLRRAKADRDISIAELRESYAVSYETAAHRFTNLATRHLDLPVHFMRISREGIVYKAYENDGVQFPIDALGAIEGQRVCRSWTARVVFDQPDQGSEYQQYTDTRTGTYWCTSMVDPTARGDFSVSVGVPFSQAKWMRGRETTARAISRCPDPACCALPSGELAQRWAERAWPSAKVHAHLLAALPPGVFPGVDQGDVIRFLAARS